MSFSHDVEQCRTQLGLVPGLSTVPLESYLSHVAVRVLSRCDPIGVLPGIGRCENAIKDPIRVLSFAAYESYLSPIGVLDLSLKGLQGLK